MELGLKDRPSEPGLDSRRPLPKLRLTVHVMNVYAHVVNTLAPANWHLAGAGSKARTNLRAVDGWGARHDASGRQSR